MGIINGIIHKEKRRFLRKRQTPEESFVWKMLRGRKNDLKWKRQVSIGSYVTDFYCASKKIALEIDGYHHTETIHKNYDVLRTRFFNEQGIRVIRITNNELVKDPRIIFKRILEMRNTLPLSSKRRGWLAAGETGEVLQK